MATLDLFESDTCLFAARDLVSAALVCGSSAYTSTRATPPSLTTGGCGSSTLELRTRGGVALQSDASLCAAGGVQGADRRDGLTHHC